MEAALSSGLDAVGLGFLWHAFKWQWDSMVVRAALAAYRLGSAPDTVVEDAAAAVSCSGDDPSLMDWFNVVFGVSVLVIAYFSPAIVLLKCLKMSRSNRGGQLSGNLLKSRVVHWALVALAMTMWTDFLVGTLWDSCGAYGNKVLPPGGVASAVVYLDGTATRADLDAAKEKGLAAVARGVFTDAELAEWNPRALAAEWPDQRLVVNLGANENIESHHATGMTLQQIADGSGTVFEDGRVPYLAEDDGLLQTSCKYSKLRDEVLARVVQPTHHREPAMVLSFLWVGAAGARTGLHKDNDAFNVLHQLYGNKSVWLYAPSDSHLLPASSKFDMGATTSLVDPFDSNATAKWPSFGAAKPVRVDVTAGDVLFIPGDWYHYAEATSLSVSLSGRAYNSCECVGSVDLLTEIALHFSGLYKVGDCTCHSTEKDA